MVTFVLAITVISCLIWCFLLGGWGNFWRCDQVLNFDQPSPLKDYPPVAAIIPARDEASVLGQSLPSLLQQHYPGPLRIILVDDQSSDNTGTVAQRIATDLGYGDRLEVVSGQPLPPGWSGKLWAVEQGWQTVQSDKQSPESWPEYIFLTDADITHGPQTIKALVEKAQRENLALVSLMVLLRCESIWERLLIPAFIFFFQKLYPFPLVNNPHHKTAAAAGGCILIQRSSLQIIGGIEALKEALIDDCTLAQKVKTQKSPIWLGLTRENWSLRPYDRLETIWQMVSRTAYTQLDYNPLLLLGTLLGMALVYLTAPIALMLAIIWGDLPLALLGSFTWVLMAIAYGPTLKFYGCSRFWGLSLPLIALLYSLMTLDSAWQHWRGRGGSWKGRVYPQGS
ncbi:glycosyltransferase [Synechocystis salina]|uniref:Glycosyltransferase n=1 Tax=Synechocystis salina LEGE 00031 TaxID=1828736 RepID=A0ABR9VTR2_9SYNC|nr:glycosyltransferase [Synechocystis salina]MBE9241434.1 glycosyltransferase [Synechocystis salina LEGE 00041]MBE9254743.1 glycosyltransferase [Synechocystis salina LEGE 00031]